MANYIEQILDRADIQILREFLINDTADSSGIDRRSYEQRVKEGEAPLHQYLERTYPECAEQDEVFLEIVQALSAHENAYFEIGMKCGARLLYQLLYERQPSDV